MGRAYVLDDAAIRALLRACAGKDFAEGYSFSAKASACSRVTVNECLARA